ncbi:MAG: hypothetical protein Q8O56_16050 [Solirubrobacteraceae bacterium]|nr:hypothetical protein [Solirubrobacteraceae bacterium]
MRPITALISSAAVCAGLAVPAAAGAAPWQEPTDVGSPAAANLGHVVGDDGFTLSAWRPPLGADEPTPLVAPALVAVRPPGQQGFGPSRRIDDLAARPVRYAKTRAALLRVRQSGGSQGAPVADVGVSYGRTSGDLGDTRPIAADVPLEASGLPVIAASPRGDVAVAWIERDADRRQLRVALRPAGGSFGAPVTLRGSGVSTAPALSFGPQGDLLLAYQHAPADGGSRRVEVRVHRAGGDYGGVIDVGPASGVTDAAPAVGHDGRLYVAWGTQDGGEEANEPYRVFARSAPRGGQFAELQGLDDGGAAWRSPGRLVLAARGDGGAQLAWTSVQPPQAPGAVASFPVRTARAGADGRFAAPVELAADGAVGDLAVSATDPLGAATLAWSTAPSLSGADPATARVVAARLPAEGAPTIEDVSEVGHVGGPRLALDAAAAPSATWISSPPDGDGRARYGSRMP